MTDPTNEIAIKSLIQHLAHAGHTRWQSALESLSAERDHAIPNLQSLRLLLDRRRDECDRLERELADAQKQRDEARREVCEADAILGTTAADTANAVARLRGWDCFGQGGGA